MLKVEHVTTCYGKVLALDDVSIEVNEGEIVSIIGANGAGKSTLMKTIMGVVRAKTGKIEYNGEEITDMKPNRIVKKGIVYVPEGREIFPELSVKDNLVMGAFCRRYSKAEFNAIMEEGFTLFPKLKERQKQIAGSLSGGEQQMLAIARGYMSDPSMIMFDEPSLGLAPVIVDEVFRSIVDLQKIKNLPVVLVEQNAYMALSISQRCYVLENGTISASGPSEEMLRDPDIKKAYLGG